MINFAARAEYRRRVELAVVYINENLTGTLDGAVLAAISGFPAAHFAGIFEGALGEQPMTYVNRLRSEKAAAALMRSPELGDGEIARLCGFTSAGELAGAFKVHFGVTPREYVKGRYLQSLADACGLQACSMAAPEKPSFDVEITEIEGESCAVFHVVTRFEGLPARYREIYKNWLPDSGYLPGENPAYEIEPQFQDQNSNGVSKLDIYLPLKPLVFSF